MNAAEQLTFLDAAERCGDEDPARRNKFDVALFSYQVVKPLMIERLMLELRGGRSFRNVPRRIKHKVARLVERAIDNEIASIMLHNFGHMTFLEIGKVFGCSKQRAEQMYNRAITKMLSNRKSANMLEDMVDYAR